LELKTFIKIIFPLLIILFSIGDFIGENKVQLIEKEWLRRAIKSTTKINLYFNFIRYSYILQLEMLISISVIIVVPFIIFIYIIKLLYAHDLEIFHILVSLSLSLTLIVFYIKKSSYFLLSVFSKKNTNYINLLSYFSTNIKLIINRLSSITLGMPVIDLIYYLENIFKFNDSIYSEYIKRNFLNLEFPIGHVSYISYFLFWYINFSLYYFLFYFISTIFLLWSIMEFFLYSILFLLLSPSIIFDFISKKTGQRSFIKVGKYIITIVLYILSLFYL
jgi:hypothetical protein